MVAGGSGSGVTTALVIICWYGGNIGVLLLNKYLLTLYGFRFPVFLTLCHMLACATLSYAVAASRLVPIQPVRRSTRQASRIVLLALIFCLTVVLGNVSLKFIPVSFTQAIGATTPAFTAVLALLVARQHESLAVYASLIPVVAGIVIASRAEPLFHLAGFLAAVAATAARALKSVLQGLLLSSPSSGSSSSAAEAADRIDSLSLLMYMAPVAVVALIPATLYFEPEAPAVAAHLGLQSRGFWALLILNSCMAYLANLFNFLVTKHTSALTLQVLGNAKGVVAATISVLCFRNPINASTVLGYGVTVCGVMLYSRAKNAGKIKPTLPVQHQPAPQPGLTRRISNVNAMVLGV